MLGGDPFHDVADDLAGAAISFGRGLRFHLTDLARHILAGALLHGRQQLLSCLFLGHAGDAFKLGAAIFFELGQVSLALVKLDLALIELAIALIDLFQLAIHRLLAALDAFLGALHLAAPASYLVFRFFKDLNFLLLCTQRNGFGPTFGLGHDAFGLSLGVD